MQSVFPDDAVGAANGFRTGPDRSAGDEVVVVFPLLVTELSTAMKPPPVIVHVAITGTAEHLRTIEAKNLPQLGDHRSGVFTMLVRLSPMVGESPSRVHHHRVAESGKLC